MREAAQLSGAAVLRAAEEHPNDPARRVALVRAAGPLRLGRILLAQGTVAPRRLAAALVAQKASRLRIGEELMAAGHLEAREVAEGLWLQHKLVAAALALMAASAREVAPAPRLVRGAR